MTGGIRDASFHLSTPRALWIEITGTFCSTQLSTVYCVSWQNSMRFNTFPSHKHHLLHHTHCRTLVDKCQMVENLSNYHKSSHFMAPTPLLEYINRSRIVAATIYPKLCGRLFRLGLHLSADLPRMAAFRHVSRRDFGANATV